MHGYGKQYVYGLSSYDFKCITVTERSDSDDSEENDILIEIQFSKNVGTLKFRRLFACCFAVAGFLFMLRVKCHQLR
jgi:hypothetical protein